MKKHLTTLLLFAAIACKAQDTTLVHVNGYVNNKQVDLIVSTYEFAADSLNQTKTTLPIGVDTTKGKEYDVNGYITLISQTGSNSLQIRYTYTDETGLRQSFASPAVNVNNPRGRFSPQRIVVKPGTLIAFSMIFSGTGTVLYNVGCDARRIR